MSETQIPYGTVERDLCAHLGRKIETALGDMAALTSTPGQSLLLGYTAVGRAAAFAGAAFEVHHGHQRGEVDPIDVAIAILQATKEAKDDPNGALTNARDILRDAAAFRTLVEAGAHYSAAALIGRIAQVTRAVAFQAGEPDSELAGMILSALVQRPDLVNRFMAEGSELLISGEIGPLTGCFSYRAIDGTIRRPDEATAARAAGGGNG